jgi:hypothetical protein
MAILKGKDGVISQGLNNLGCISSFSITMEADTLEATCMGHAGWRQFEGSLKSWNGTVEAYFEDDYTAGQIPDIGETITITFKVTDGDTTPADQVTYTGDAVVTSRSVEVGVEDLVTMSFDLTGSGPLTETFS